MNNRNGHIRAVLRYTQMRVHGHKLLSYMNTIRNIFAILSAAVLLASCAEYKYIGNISLLNGAGDTLRVWMGAEMASEYNGYTEYNGIQNGGVTFITKEGGVTHIRGGIIIVENIKAETAAPSFVTDYYDLQNEYSTVLYLIEKNAEVLSQTENPEERADLIEANKRLTERAYVLRHYLEQYE